MGISAPPTRWFTNGLSPLTLRSSSMARSFTRSSSIVASLWIGAQGSFPGWLSTDVPMGCLKEFCACVPPSWLCLRISHSFFSCGNKESGLGGGRGPAGGPPHQAMPAPDTGVDPPGTRLCSWGEHTQPPSHTLPPPCRGGWRAVLGHSPDFSYMTVASILPPEPWHPLHEHLLQEMGIQAAPLPPRWGSEKGEAGISQPRPLARPGAGGGGRCSYHLDLVLQLVIQAGFLFYLRF